MYYRSHVDHFQRQYGQLTHSQLLYKLKNSSYITKRLKRETIELEVHHGCVNTLCWNDRGSVILSGSDDQQLIVTDPFSCTIRKSVHSGHRENIFSAKFLPETNDMGVVSCSGDGQIFHTDLTRAPSSPTISRNCPPPHRDPSQPTREGCFNCHGSTTCYEIRVIPQTPNLFFSCSEDCTVRLFDLRTKSNCLKSLCYDDILIRSKWAITSMDINPFNPNEIVCACSDSSVRLYDHRKLSTGSFQSETKQQLRSRGKSTEVSINGLVGRFLLNEPTEPRPRRITSVVYNRYGTEILASYSTESLYLIDPKNFTSQAKQKEQLSIHQQEKKQQRSNKHSSTPISTRATRQSPPKEASSATRTRPSASSNEQRGASHFKRLRLRGDWSDTGPESRPQVENDTLETENEQQHQERTTETNSGNSEQQQPQRRNLQNYLMQRMSDILTQLVSRTTTSQDDEQSAPNQEVSNNNSEESTVNQNTVETSSQVTQSVSMEDDQANNEKPSSSSIDEQSDDFFDSSENAGQFTTTKPIESMDVEQEHHSETSLPSTEMVTQPFSQSPRRPSNEHPIVNSPSSSLNVTTDETSINVNNNNREEVENEDETSRETYSVIFHEDDFDEDESDENDSEEDEDDNEDDERKRSIRGESTNRQESANEAASASAEQQPRRRPRPNMIEKFDRIMKKRELDRKNEEDMLKDIPSPTLINSYDGHRNARTMIKECNFWGDRHVMSGSDCGHIFIWDKETSRIVRIIVADRHVVNCLQPHPLNYPILASSGIDYDIKLWSPLLEHAADEQDIINQTIKRNSLMLEETSSTITVPATFMLRMLTNFYRFRRTDDE
ncbi:unnamed protein product [Didymodactylos carnosus]|uniref:DDB1- and CUL4-associated factor 6 n=1 Tax=Didymodactylos carnosus TaxID=1234261 RepID=A0A813YN91_9BILA|nr:unnamed protein product [Didymodactylos carnosus]CAF0970566.1 unnamed protein product [Didymodactylos carnosus]CAF3671646.1 unnamed protein product [Didymodactylos carnosus]CAF3742014.1 unnamed protein product [Didymodactylos carnosus]